MVAFFDGLLDPKFAGRPFMRHYLDYYWDIYWDLHLGVKGEAIPPQVRTIAPEMCGDHILLLPAVRSDPIRPRSNTRYEPPTPENAHLYRAAALTWRKAWREERRRNDGNRKLTNPTCSWTPLPSQFKSLRHR